MLLILAKRVILIKKNKMPRIKLLYNLVQSYYSIKKEECYYKSAFLLFWGLKKLIDGLFIFFPTLNCDVIYAHCTKSIDK